MENIVLTIGGLLKKLNVGDLFFFVSILVLILLLVYIVYLIRTEEDNNKVMTVKPFIPKDDKKKDLKNIITNIETNYEPKPIDLSKYEQEMEDTAVISYEELLKRTNTGINYDEEYNSHTNEIDIKKIDNTNPKLPKIEDSKYLKEETFVTELKNIQKNLVR